VTYRAWLDEAADWPDEREPDDPAQRALYRRLMRERYGDPRALERERARPVPPPKRNRL
jgi:hypothetical protein